jgi:hypothetical protein
MRVGSSSPQPFALPSPVERDATVQRAPAREREPLKQVDESVEEVRRSEPRRRPTQRVDGNDRVQRQNLSRVREFNELPANNRNAIATYTATARLSSNDGAGELVGIDEIV